MDDVAPDEAVARCLLMIGRLPDQLKPSASEAAALHDDIRNGIDTACRNLHAAGHHHQDVEDVAYALVAFADETALTASEPLRHYWLPRLLQRIYFAENNAGENFFHRLNWLRNDPQRKQVLSVYAACLLLGFQGSYQLQGNTAALEVLITDLGRELKATVHPFADRPDLTEDLRAKRRGPPAAMLPALAALGVVLALFTVSKMWLGNMTSSLEQELNLHRVDHGPPTSHQHMHPGEQLAAGSWETTTRRGQP